MSDSRQKRDPEDTPSGTHDYDGIEELNHPLPSWWVNKFYLTILFSMGYFLYYNLGDGPSLVKEYQQSRLEYSYHQALQKGQQKTMTEEELRAWVKDPEKLKTGRQVFQSKCISCHGAQGQGGIGPNLTDGYWIHGGQMKQILTTITQGVLEKGMPPWGALLKQEELYAVTAFVKSLQGTHPPNPKPPQGVREEE